MTDNEIRGGLVNRLRGLACPAGRPWTGTTPEVDHGHTDCMIIHMAADRIERLEAEGGWGTVKRCESCRWWWPTAATAGTCGSLNDVTTSAWFCANWEDGE